MSTDASSPPPPLSRAVSAESTAAARRWVGIILALLIGNALAVVVLIIKAGPADARRVLPDYYQRAAAYDQTMAGATASVSLGWAVDVGIGRDGRTTVVVRDRDGQPVTGAQVHVGGFHRSHAQHPFAGDLVEGAPGRYAGEVTPWPRPGWSTLEVRVERADDRFVRSVALEIGAGQESVP